MQDKIEEQQIHHLYASGSSKFYLSHLDLLIIIQVPMKSENALMPFFTITMIIYSFFMFQAFAFSPSFPRQENQDPLNDGIGIATGQNVSLNYSDISSVSYYSNGTNLEATIWMSLEFDDDPSIHLPAYGMFLDADGNSDTGYHGIDFIVKVRRDNISKFWLKTVEEISSAGETRIIAPEEKVKEPCQKGKNYVHLSLDLEQVNNPNPYRISFFTTDILKRENSSDKVIDITGWFYIPPATLTVSYPSVFLSPGEEGYVDLQINSTSAAYSQVYLDVNKSKSIYTQDIRIFAPINKVIIPPYGSDYIRLYLRSTESARLKLTAYNLPVVLNASFSSQPFFQEPDDSIYSFIENTNRILKLNINVVLLPALHAQERFEKFLDATVNLLDSFKDSYSEISKVVAVTIVSGIGAYVIKRIKNRRDEQKEHKISEGS